MSRRARRKERTLRRIEEAGWRLFNCQGYEATSTRQIAEAADIAAGTLFNYFPEKRSLLIHLMQRQVDAAIAGALETADAATIEGQLLHLFDSMNDCYARNHRLSRVFVKELLFIDGAHRAECAAWTFSIVQAMAGLISSAQGQEELDRSDDAMEVAQQIFSTYYFGLLTWLGGTIPSRAAHEAQVQASLRLLLRGASRRAA